jgi:hypothetical protein
MVTESELAQFLRDNPPAKQFVPYSYLSKEADALTVYFEGDADYSRRLNEHITVYHSIETDEIIGCRIKGISSILQDLPHYFGVKHGGIELSIVFFAFRGGADNQEVSEAINDLARVASARQMVLESALSD